MHFSYFGNYTIYFIAIFPHSFIYSKKSKYLTDKSYFLCFADIVGNCEFFNGIRDVDVNQDEGSWYMAFTFLLFFLFAILYGVFVTVIKV